MRLDEDARYLCSSQYRLWSFTPSALHDLRKTSNRLAIERIRASIPIVSQETSTSTSTIASGENTENDTGDETMMANSRAKSSLNALANLKVTENWELSAEDELRMVSYYGKQLLSLGDFLNVSTEVKTTALQYFKRFYTTQSILIYQPTAVLKTALFFSTKTENHYISLSEFTSKVGKTTEKEILAYEFPLTQGLRFTFDIRHPFRALEGAVMEIQALAESDGTIATVKGGVGVGVAEVPKHAIKRVKEAHGRVKDILKTKAGLSDAYFHFTPSQIMFAALHLADTELTKWYLGLKISDQVLLARLMKTLEQCGAMMREIKMEGETEAEIKEMKKLALRLRKCHKLAGAGGVGAKTKREGEDDEERAAKKRRLEREGLEQEGEKLFGPELGKTKVSEADPFGPALATK